MKKLLGLALFAIGFLAGCQTPEMARSASNYDLCSQVYVYGNTKYYADEINRRRLNCNQYSGALSKEANQPGALQSLTNGLNNARDNLNAPMDPKLMQQHQSVLNANQLQQMQRRGFTCTPSGNGTYYCKQ